MPMILPTHSSRLKRLTACGILQTNDAAVLARLEKLREASPEEGYSVRDGDARFVQFVAGSKPKEHSPKHFHIELISCDCFSEPATEQTNSSVAEMQGMIDQFYGLPIEVSCSAVFWTPVKELPAIGLILGCRVESELESMTIKQSSATFTVTRGPIDEIYWSRLEAHPELLNVSLTVKKTTVLDRDFLTSLAQTMNAAFDFLVLEKYVDAARR
jgi:hypothetical protein